MPSHDPRLKKVNAAGPLGPGNLPPIQAMPHPEQPIHLVLEDDRQLPDMLRLLWRTGFTRFGGCLAGGLVMMHRVARQSMAGDEAIEKAQPLGGGGDTPGRKDSVTSWLGSRQES
ncbi:hypothetical protein [Geminicoccus roseus]|uniref:hypothetical protein n=1 Tax=Geminicoccus roseus TaxID=404900 RepID=UPI000405CD4C|nr:hypothetical protein [Geminicoccus roseus]